MNSINLILALIAYVVYVSNGEYFDCEHYTTQATCEADDDCEYKTNGNCRADCGSVPSGQCDAAKGCVDAGETCFDAETTTTSTSSTSSTSTTTKDPNANTTESVTTQSVETTKSEETTNSAETTTVETTGDGGSGTPARCDGTVQAQQLETSSYSCGDKNIDAENHSFGCVYIDASSTCSGTEFGECGDEDNAWPSFQKALDSLNGEVVVIIVKSGTYSGEGNYNIYGEYEYLNIFSESGSSETIIDCQGNGFGLHFYQVTMKMEGFTVQNCIATERDTFELPDYATNDYINDGSNTGRLGGAFFLDRVYSEFDDMVIVDNGGEYGGAIFQYQQSIRMNNSIIQYNCATNSGGAVFGLFANIYLYNSYVLCNTADVLGGGLFNYQTRTDILDATLVSDNSAQYANEFFCDRSTANIDSDNDGMINDNSVGSWNMNEITYCCCNDCAFYNLDRSLDFCAATDVDSVDIDQPTTDDGECSADIIMASSTSTTSDGGVVDQSTTMDMSSTEDGVDVTGMTGMGMTNTPHSKANIISIIQIAIISFISFIVIM